MLAILAGIEKNGGMQGRSDPNVELLDAAALCRHLVAEDSVHAFLADHRRDLFPDEMFADLFPSGRGRPSVPADVVATVMVLQALEGLSDRDAATALRTNIAWKVAAGLALDDEGIHYSVLTYWRSRLRASDVPERIFDAVRSVIDATGILAGKRRRALDSTLLDDAVATQDTVTQLVSAIRRVRRLVPEAAAVTVTAHDYDTSGKPVCAWDDPDAKAALVSGLVNDARSIIDALDGVALDEAQADAVGLLALVAGQDVGPATKTGHGGSRSDLVARRQRQPASPLPRRATQPTRPLHPRRRDQPAPTRQPRPRPPRHLDPRVKKAGPGQQTRPLTYGINPTRAASSHPRH